MKSLPYKNFKSIEKTSIYPFPNRNSTEPSENTHQNSETQNNLKNNKHNLNLKNFRLIYRYMNEAHKNGDTIKMDQLLYNIIVLSKIEPLYYSFDIIKFEVKSVLYSCLELDAPFYLMTKTLELISQILQQEKEGKEKKAKMTGDMFFKADNESSMTLIEILFHLTCHFLSDPLEEEENNDKFIILMHILICLNRASSFKLEATEQILNLFFKNPPFLIHNIININPNNSYFPQLVELMKLSCCKLIYSISLMRISKIDAENLFVFVCTNWKPIFNSAENQIRNNITSDSMKYLISTVYNFLKLIPEIWVNIFIQNEAWELVESCLVDDDIELAAPAVECTIQLVAQRTNISIKYDYFINLFYTYKGQKNQEQQQEKSNQNELNQIDNLNLNDEDLLQPFQQQQQIGMPTPNTIDPAQQNQIVPNPPELLQSSQINNSNELIQNEKKAPDLEELIQQPEIDLIDEFFSLEFNNSSPQPAQSGIPSNLVSLACRSIERIVIQNSDHAEQFVSFGIFATIGKIIDNFPFSLECECINCICAIINSHITYGIESLLESNIIGLLIEFARGNINNMQVCQIINAINNIFNLAILNGLHLEALEQFEESDGNDAMYNISNKNDMLVNESIDRLLITYNSIQIES